MTIKSERLSKNVYNAGIAVALLILLSVVLLTYRLHHLTNEYGKWVVHTHHVIEHLQTLLTYVVDAETGQRGFVITGEDAFLKPYNNALRQIDSQVVELKGLNEDDPSLQERLGRIHTLIDSKLAELALTIKVRQSAGFDSAQVLVKKNIDKATMDSIRTNIAIARNQETSLLRERTKNYQMYMHRLRTALFFGGLTDILIFLVIIILLRFENDRRTRVEEELRNYQEHLNALVEERTGELKASEQRWATTLASLAEAVIITDEAGHIVFMNTIAESITGRTVKETIHKQLPEVFNIMTGERQQPLDDPVVRVLKEGVVTDLFDKVILVRKDGKDIPIDGNGARILQEDGTLTGVVFVFRDITKQRQADEALRNQAALLNFAHDAIIVRNAKNEITFWNRGAEETYGWAQVEVVGRVTYDLLKTRFPKPMEEINEEAGQTGEWNGELIHTRKDSQEIVVASRWALQRDIWGRHTATLEINRDITDRKKAEEELRNSEERFHNERNLLQQIVNKLPYSFVLYSPDLRIEYTNHTVLKIYDWTLEQVVGKTIREVFSKEISDIFVPLLQKVRDTGEAFSGEVSYHVGEDLITSIPNIVPLFNGKKEISHILLLNIYITERKRMERALRESEKRLDLALEGGKMGMWEWDVKKNQSKWNDKEAELLGLPPTKEFISTDEFFNHVHPHDRDNVAKNLEALFEKGTDYNDEFRIIREDQEVRWLAAVGQIYRDNEGKPLMVIGVNYDITERKHMEEELRHNVEQLASANRDLESFSYSVSHDLKNPLHTIESFVDFLMEDYADRLDEEGQNYLRRIHSGVKKMKTLIDDMLSLSRIGRQEMKKVDIDLSAITRNYLKELETAEPQRKDEIVIQDNVHINADPRLIHLALENLLRNAWKFTSKKEVTRIEFGTVSSTSLRHQPIDRWPCEVENQTVYFVKDNGAGFDAEFADKIFEPFKRVHAQKEFSGTGVGLSIVQRVIGRHGGKVWAEGETGKGATFYFTLDGRS
jgi:PAS domain S-box-containing protein